MNPLAYLNDPTSRITAGASSAGASVVAFVAQSPVETVIGLVVAVLAPLALGAVNRWIDRRYQLATLRASLAVAERAAEELRAELQRREAAESTPKPVLFDDADARD